MKVGTPADMYSRMAVGAVRKASPAQPATQTAAAQPAERQPTSAAQVSISSRARDLASAAASDSGVNVSKVEGLKAKLATGELKFDSGTVAARMVEQMA